MAQLRPRSRLDTERRALVATMRPAIGQTRATSPRQLPTDHDHDGEPRARSANIRVINRRHFRLDRGLSCAMSLGANLAVRRKPLDRSFHISCATRPWVACRRMSCRRNRRFSAPDQCSPPRNADDLKAGCPWPSRRREVFRPLQCSRNPPRGGPVFGAPPLREIQFVGCPERVRACMASLDHLIRPQQHGRRDREAESLGGLEA